MSVSKVCSADGRMIIECAAGGGIIISRGNRSALRKPGPDPHCPPQIPDDLNWDGT
jgi:hypothetical protein